MKETIIDSIVARLGETRFPGIPSSDAFEEECKNAISKVEGIEGIDYKKGSSRFPDITFSLDGSKIGVEVKLITTSTWKANGNSAVASTAVKDIDEVYILAGRFVKNRTPEYKMKPMGECISNVKVTHNPRYEIDMEYNEGDFCENILRVNYDSLRIIPKEERAVIIGRYVAEDRYKKLIANDNVKNKLLAECFILFPEMFSKSNSKFARMNGWLFGRRILSGNIRDSVSGNGKFKFKGFKIPKIYGTLGSLKKEFFKRIEKIPSEVLEYAWKEDVSARKLLDPTATIPPEKEARFNLWVQLVCTMHSSYKSEMVEGVVGLDNTKIENHGLKFKATIKEVLTIKEMPK